MLQFGFHFDEDNPVQFAHLLLITVGFTTVIWVSVTFLTSPEPKEKLLSFYRKVRPNASMWGPVAREATDIPPVHDGILNLINWISGVAMVYCFLFGLGHIILQEYVNRNFIPYRRIYLRRYNLLPDEQTRVEDII